MSDKKNPTARIKTSEGDIIVDLFLDKAPKTVENFIGLSNGEKKWKAPSGEEVVGKPLYNGTIFHRCIPNFMIQGGCPRGNGTGNPGYRFEDEFESGLKFDKPGLLAMANSGPNTNGSQFFITVVPCSWLNNKHTIFGEVAAGMDIVEKIIKAPKGAQDRPTNPVTIEEISIK